MSDDRGKPMLTGEARAVLLHGLLLLVVLVLVFPGVFLRGDIISPSDMLGAIPPWNRHVETGDDPVRHRLMADVITAFHPYYTLVHDSFARGEWPLWNHLQFSGMPLLANCQSAPFYPPRLLHAFFNVHTATTLFILLKLWMCGMMAYACARGMRLSRDTARFFSIGWMLASYNLIWANWSLPDVAIWVPLLFLGVEMLLDGRYRRGFYALAAGGTLIFLAGHPETAMTMCMGIGLYFVLRLGLDGRRGERLWKPVGVAAGAAGISLLVCMPVILPFAEYLLNSHTFYYRPDKDFLPLSGGAVVSFWLPRFFGAFVDQNFWGRTNSNLVSMLYSGIAVWACIGLLAVKRRADAAPRDRRAAALAITVLILMLLAFNTPGVNIVTRLPILSSTRICYYASFVTFALPLLAAVGLERYFAQKRRLPELGWLLAVAGVAGAVVAFHYQLSGGLIRMMDMDLYIRRQMLAAIVFAAASCLALAGFCVYPKRALWAGVLTALLAADLILANSSMNPTMRRENAFPDTKLTAYMQSLGDHRFGIAEGNIPSGLLSPYGLEEWQAYDGLYPQRMWHLTSKLGDALWGKFEPLRSIAYYLNDPAFPPLIPEEKRQRMEIIAELDGLQVLQNTDALPRAYLVPRIEVEPDVDALFAKLAEDAFDPRETVLTERPPRGPLPDATVPAADLGSARVVYRGGTRVVIQAEAVEKCLLVLSDAYYPGWTATINGAPSEIFPAYYVYRGLVLPPGAHEIVYNYMPWTFKAGMAISVATLLAMLGVTLLARKSQRASSK